MKKIIFFISVLAISGWVIAFPARAQESVSEAPDQVKAIIQQEEVNTGDLGIENPGILPTSPFYFLKEWRRGIKKMFTFDPVKKAELELNETNERAAEIKKLEDVVPSNIEAITKAVNNYQKNVERLKNRLEGLKETSQNPNVDKLLDKLVERSLQHQQLFENLKAKFEGKTELKEQLKAGQEKINEVIVKIPEKFEDVAAFKQRLEKTIKGLQKKNGISKLPDYYKNLAKECESKGAYDCCMASVNNMAEGGYKLAENNACPEGYRINGLYCISAYSWCEPVKEISLCEKNGGKVSDITECNGEINKICTFPDGQTCYIENIKGGKCEGIFSPKVLCGKYQ